MRKVYGLGFHCEYQELGPLSGLPVMGISIECGRVYVISRVATGGMVSANVFVAMMLCIQVPQEKRMWFRSSAILAKLAIFGWGACEMRLLFLRASFKHGPTFARHTLSWHCHVSGVQLQTQIRPLRPRIVSLNVC